MPRWTWTWAGNQRSPEGSGGLSRMMGGPQARTASSSRCPASHRTSLTWKARVWLHGVAVRTLSYGGAVGQPRRSNARRTEGWPFLGEPKVRDHRGGGRNAGGGADVGPKGARRSGTLRQPNTGRPVMDLEVTAW